MNYEFYTKNFHFVFSELSISTEIWDFEGTKEELVNSFCCLNSYNRQFYPQFQEHKDDSDVIVFRTVMLGFQEDTIPFQVTVTFYQKNDKKITTTDTFYLRGAVLYEHFREKLSWADTDYEVLDSFQALRLLTI